MQRWANKYLRQINGILQPASAYGIIAATDPTGALAAVLGRLPRSFSPRLFAQASGATRSADAATVCAGAVLCRCWSGCWRPVEQRGDAKRARDVSRSPGGCCVRSPGRLASETKDVAVQQARRRFWQTNPAGAARRRLGDLWCVGT